MKPLVALTMISTLCSIASAEAGERFACNMKGLTAAEHEHHQTLTRKLLNAVAERVELPDGYGFRLDRTLFSVAAEWVSLEARCCPFFSFHLALEKKQGPFWLKLTGSDGVKAFIRADFDL